MLYLVTFLLSSREYLLSMHSFSVIAEYITTT